MSAERAAVDSEALARRLAELADSKAASEIVVLDMRKLVSYTDFLAICTARNERQARAIADEVKLRLKQERQLLPGRLRGGRGGRLDRPRLPRLRAARLHRGGAQALPARGPLARGAEARASGVTRWRPRAPLRCRAWVASRGRSSATAAPKWMRRLLRGTHGTGHWSATRRRRRALPRGRRGRCRGGGGAWLAVGDGDRARA